MNIKPVADHIVVKFSKPEDKSSGGIILLDTAKEKSTGKGYCCWNRKEKKGGSHE